MPRARVGRARRRAAAGISVTIVSMRAEPPARSSDQDLHAHERIRRRHRGRGPLQDLRHGGGRAGISFAVRRGTTTALLGGNGAGKTTTLSMLMGVLTPTAGSVTVLGEEMPRYRDRVLPRINFTSPYVDLPKRLSVRENLAYSPISMASATRACALPRSRGTSTGDLLRRPYGSLSAGQRTRVSLAKAVINEPEVLLLDEPTASLDPDIGDRMRTYLEQYQRRTGCTMLLASHHMGEVERMCDDVIMLRAGRVVDQGSPQALVARYGRANMEEVFLDIARGRDSGERLPGGGVRRGHGVMIARPCRLGPLHRRRRVAAARARRAAPPPLPDPAVVDAHRVDDVLPDGHDGRLGVPHDLSRADQQLPAETRRASSSAPCCSGTCCSAASSASR